jgi:replication factor C subunit 3/5
MLSINKLRPNNIYEFVHNQDVAGFLHFLALHDNVPHIILVGPKGSGMKTLSTYFLKCLYGDKIYNTINKQYPIPTTGQKNKEIDIIQSESHIIIEPEGTNRDKYTVQEIVKKCVNNRSLLVNTNRTFKSVVIYGIENLALNSQAALRRSMEKYAYVCRFIMTCNNMSSIIDPLRSRCLVISVSAPTKADIKYIVYNCFQSDTTNFDIEVYNKIVKDCNGNIKKAMFLYDYYKYDIIDSNKIDQTINGIINKILTTYSKPSIPTILQSQIIPEMYKLLTANIKDNELLKLLLYGFLKKVPNDQIRMYIINSASKTEYHMFRGRRSMLCLPFFINSVIRALVTYPHKPVKKAGSKTANKKK